MTDRTRSMITIVAGLLFALAVGTDSRGRALAGGPDFIRGDANGDGVVSASDAHAIGSFLFRGVSSVECFDAADKDDSGRVNISDIAGLMNFLYAGEDPPPPAPFPEPGPDPTPDAELPCAAYGNGSPLPDPAARLEVLDAVTQGGEEDTLILIVAVSSSVSLAGYSGRLDFPAGVLGDVLNPVEDLSGTLGFGFAGASAAGDSLTFGFLSTFVDEVTWIQPGESTAVLRLTACLRPGTPAGEYPVVLAAGELVDAESARSILPALEGGTLTVAAAVTGGTRCGLAPPPPPPPPELNVRYLLLDADGAPGGTAGVPFIIRADAGIQGYAFSLDFDEEVLEVTSIVVVWAKPDGSRYAFLRTEYNNRNDHPGSAGVDEGFAIGAFVFDFLEPVTMPADTDIEAVRLRFAVRPDAPLGPTAIQFLDGGRVSGEEVPNTLTAYGFAYTPDLASSFVFVNSRLTVLPDITLFIRGDTDGNEVLGLNDPVQTFNYLFLGGRAPHCFDAADADDSGAINLNDGVYTLNHLFLGAGSPPPPFPGIGEDPTRDDPLGCRYRSDS